MSQQENNNLQDDTAPAQGIGVGGNPIYRI